VKARGIIISSAREDPPGALSIGPLDTVELRRYALYWDLIDWPQGTVAPDAMPPEVIELQSARVLSMPRLAVAGRAVDDVVRMQLEIFRVRNEEDPGSWAVAQSSSQLMLPDDVSEPARVLEVELFDALPVPTAEVPILRILDFKSQRGSELERLRSATDRLYLDALESTDRARASDRAVNQLRRAVGDMHRVLTESAIGSTMASVKVSLNTAPPASSDTNAMLPSGAGDPWRASLGMVAGAVKICWTATRRPKGLPSAVRDYAYLALARSPAAARVAG
jgi:hypothetical protein